MFEVVRADGKAETEIVLELLRTQQPNDIVTYEEICRVLSTEEKPEIARKDAQAVVNRIKRRLLHEEMRGLEAVYNVGYRVISAEEHRRLALRHRQRSNNQMRKGLQLLDKVRWEELSEEGRRAHEGQLILTGALYQQIRAVEERQSATDAMIVSLVGGKSQKDEQQAEAFQSVIERLEALESQARAPHMAG